MRNFVKNKIKIIPLVPNLSCYKHHLNKSTNKFNKSEIKIYP